VTILWAVLIVGAGAMVQGTVGIGGPVALLYQREGARGCSAHSVPASARAPLLSLVVLGVGGQVDGALLLQGAALIPFAAVGFVLSNPCRTYLDRGWTRPAVVGLSAVGAVVLLVQAKLT
jgi:hypothetical protein